MRVGPAPVGNRGLGARAASAPARRGGETVADDFILETQGLTKYFGGFAALSDVNLRVRRGHLHSVIGPNGAGKTTLFNCLSGVLKPSAGRIILRGRDTAVGRRAAQPHHLARRGLGRAFQITSLFPTLTVLENVRLAVQARARSGSMSWIMWRSADRMREVTERAAAIVEDVGLAGKEHVPAFALSHGDQRKLDLGIALGSEPEVLLLDEPTAGVSREDVPGIVEVIERIRRTAELTILLVEHKMDIVLNISDRITVLQHGKFLAEGTPREIVGNREVQAAYLGEEHVQHAGSA